MPRAGPRAASGAILRTVAAGLGLLVLAGCSESDKPAGKTVFRQCQACHTVERGQHRMGPSLFGVVGRMAGSQDGYRYTDAMKNYNVVWTEETLDAYLADPRGVVRGNRMAFPGIKDPQKRSAVIDYLKQASK